MYSQANSQGSAYRGRGAPRGPRPYQTGGFRTYTGPKLQPKGELIVTITLASLEGSESAADEDPPSDQDLKITDAKYIASYNWHSEKNSTIIVPSSPPRWTPPAVPPTLAQDPPNRIYYRDINSANFPTYPIEPAVRAIYHPSAAKEDFDPSTISIFACSSTLGNLLRFALSVESSFHFKIEKTGNTLFFVRQEKTPDDHIENVKGYGHTFPEAYTTWDADVRESQSHQRISSLNFGGLKIVVRAEGDGYLKDKVPHTEEGVASGDVKAPISSGYPDDKAEDNLDLADTFKSLALPSKFTQPRTPSKTLTVDTSAITPIPQAAIFELKTRSDQREFSMDDVLPRLWLNCIPNFILAQHHCGAFNNDSIQIKDVREDIEYWEKRHSKELKAFWQVLKKLIAIMNGLEDGETKIGIWRVSGGELQVRKLEEQDKNSWAALPESVKVRWIGIDAENEDVEAEDIEDQQAQDRESDDEERSDEDNDFLKF